ncbi:MAG: hypothetical protein ACRDUY_13720 [Nitriliruptorales bacterium]
MPSTTNGLDDVAGAIREREDDTRRALEDLVRIPSISAAGHDPAEVEASAAATAELLRDAGLDEVRLLEVGDAHPYVYGEWLGAGPDALTVLLYAHHDVQPVGTPERWASPPFSGAFGGAPYLLTGIEDPATNAHGEDESLHLADFTNACVAEALLFAELAARAEQLG